MVRSRRSILPPVLFTIPISVCQAQKSIDKVQALVSARLAEPLTGLTCASGDGDETEISGCSQRI
jgi:hypothetical protein